VRINIETGNARKKKPVKCTKKKREFSKIWLAACIIISIIYTSASFVLAWFDKNPVSELSIAIIDSLWGASGISFVGYAIQNSVRAYTSAKFGLIETINQEKEEQNAD
jgi:hypothetical protein